MSLFKKLGAITSPALFSKELGKMVDWDKNRSWMLPLAAAAVGGYAGYAALGTTGAVSIGASLGGTAGSQIEGERAARKQGRKIEQEQRKQTERLAREAFYSGGSPYAAAGRSLLMTSRGKRGLGA